MTYVRSKWQTFVRFWWCWFSVFRLIVFFTHTYMKRLPYLPVCCTQIFDAIKEPLQRPKRKKIHLSFFLICYYLKKGDEEEDRLIACRKIRYYITNVQFHVFFLIFILLKINVTSKLIIRYHRKAYNILVRTFSCAMSLFVGTYIFFINKLNKIEIGKHTKCNCKYWAGKIEFVLSIINQNFLFHEIATIIVPIHSFKYT